MSKVIITIFFLLFATPIYSESNLKINEFLANQASGQDEWVEFYNPDNLDLVGYWIDDDTDFSSDSGNSSRKQLTASNLNTTNPNFPYMTLTSSIFNDTCSSICDYVVLFAPDGSTVDQFQYTTEQIKEEGKTIGRSPDGTNNWVVLSSSTQGAANSAAQPSPSPTPSPSPSPKSPSPTTSSSKSTSTAKSPTPNPSPQAQSSKTQSATVLGSKLESTASSTPSASPATPASPSPSPKTEENSDKTKIAAVLSGSGLVLIGLAGGIYLWYTHKSKKDNEE